LMALIAVALVSFGNSMAATTLLLGLWGLVATAAPVGWWTWLARTLPEDAEAGGGLMVAIIQLAIASGATVGGLVFDANGYRGARWRFTVACQRRPRNRRAHRCEWVPVSLGSHGSWGNSARSNRS